jgi:microcystin-dependent protein
MKRICILTCFALFGISSVVAQVGVNTATPDSSAALDIQSPSGGSDVRGVLIPRMSTIQRTGIVDPATSLMVFDTTQMCFFYHLGGGTWTALVPSGPGAPSVNGNVTLSSGSVTAPAVNTTTLSVTGFSNNALVPTGAIMMWSGNPGTIPAGWALCDGTAGRPNLLGKFIVGYDPGAAPGPTNATPDGTTTNYGTVRNTGGETGHVIQLNELPQHTHDFSGTTTTNGAHNHTASSYDGRQQNNDGAGPRNDLARPGGSVTTSTDGNHSHTFNGTTAVNTTTNTIIENRPPYYVLAYIIKL